MFCLATAHDFTSEYCGDEGYHSSYYSQYHQHCHHCNTSVPLEERGVTIFAKTLHRMVVSNWRLEKYISQILTYIYLLSIMDSYVSQIPQNTGGNADFTGVTGDYRRSCHACNICDIYFSKCQFDTTIPPCLIHKKIIIWPDLHPRFNKTSCGSVWQVFRWLHTFSNIIYGKGVCLEKTWSEIQRFVLTNHHWKMLGPLLNITWLWQITIFSKCSWGITKKNKLWECQQKSKLCVGVTGW